MIKNILKIQSVFQKMEEFEIILTEEKQCIIYTHNIYFITRTEFTL